MLGYTSTEHMHRIFMMCVSQSNYLFSDFNNTKLPSFLNMAGSLLISSNHFLILLPTHE